MAVDLHRGGIDVESSEGEGSRFTVRLPLRAESPDWSPSGLIAKSGALTDA
jgi:light-regulated signal transduction histidine kinase (bacteriophytochrome)